MVKLIHEHFSCKIIAEISLKFPCKIPLFPEFSIYKFPNIIDSDDQLPDLSEVEQEPECETDQHVPELN